MTNNLGAYFVSVLLKRETEWNTERNGKRNESFEGGGGGAPVVDLVVSRLRNAKSVSNQVIWYMADGQSH